MAAARWIASSRCSALPAAVSQADRNARSRPWAGWAARSVIVRVPSQSAKPLLAGVAGQVHPGVIGHRGQDGGPGCLWPFELPTAVAGGEVAGQDVQLAPDR